MTLLSCQGKISICVKGKQLGHMSIKELFGKKANEKEKERKQLSTKGNDRTADSGAFGTVKRITEQREKNKCF